MEIACQYSRRRKGEDIAERLLLYSSPLGCEHIGYFENTTALPEKVPFEWHAGKDGSPVLLLWLDETAFYEPLHRAHVLVGLLQEEEKRWQAILQLVSPN